MEEIPLPVDRDAPGRSFMEKNSLLCKGLLSVLFLILFYGLVHIHVASYSSLKREKYFLKLAKFWHKKTIAHFHPHKPDVIFEKSTQKEYIDFFTSVNRVIVLSPQWQRWLKEALGITENVQVIYNPCPTVSDGFADHSNKYYLLSRK